jgi:hypothetical protein
MEANLLAADVPIGRAEVRLRVTRTIAKNGTNISRVRSIAVATYS